MDDSRQADDGLERRRVARIVEEAWREVLGLRELDRDRGFVELGGTSLLATRLVTRIGKRLGLSLPVTSVFEHSTLRRFLSFVEGGPSTEAGEGVVPSPDREVRAVAAPGDRDIAIVGMACRFPGANTLDEFWNNLLTGKDSIRILSKEELAPGVPEELRSDPRYVRARGLIDRPYELDAPFFDISPMEAKLIDPQQRVLLEVAWEALERAGQAPGSRDGRVAVYAGIEDNSYYKDEILPYPDAERRAGRFPVMTGNEKDFVAMRIAHKLDLRGPAVSVHTACSTSLVAIIMAARSLRHGECDLAIAGGASIHFPSNEGYYFQEGGVFSPDGRCRPFDADAQGTIFTDGVGVVILKRLSDALRDRNTIHAVIKGGAINNDGGERASFSAPSVAGQSACIADAHDDAGIDARTIQYLEAHGTATPVGDPIELEALRRAFRRHTEDNRFCGLGSVKSNIGHTTAAAGVAGLIKTALALRYGTIPPTIHFRSPNPALELERSPFFIVDRPTEWRRGNLPRRAGISSFGIGGTNSHLILEEAPAEPQTEVPVSRPFEILPVSARSASQRDLLLHDLARADADVRDLAFTLQHGRARFRYRGARVRLAGGSDDRVVERDQLVEEPRLAFVFPGQGSQYVGMGRSLYESLPEYRVTFDRCAELLSAHLGRDFKALVFNEADPHAQETLENTRFTQPALFAIEISLARMLVGWGLRPDALIGHSVGEFTAACLAGTFTLEEGLELICERGRLMGSLPPGKMLSVRGPVDEVLKAANGEADVASINSPIHTVLAGEAARIAAVQARLEAAGFQCRLLFTSHAFHSSMMDPVVPEFLAAARRARLRAPGIAIHSTVTAKPLDEAQATDPMYWASHLRQTVNFSRAVEGAIGAGVNVFLEVGPRTTLSTLVLQHLKGANGTAVSLLGDRPDAVTELGALGSALARLWTAGIELPWSGIWSGGRRIGVLPYPFERKVFRFSEGRGPKAGMAEARNSEAELPSPELPGPDEASIDSGEPGETAQPDRLIAELGALVAEHLGMPLASPRATFVECGLDSLAMVQIGVELGKRYGVTLSLRDLMERTHTLEALARHLLAHAPPEKLRRAPARGAPARAASAVPRGPEQALEAIQKQLARITELLERGGVPISGGPASAPRGPVAVPEQSGVTAEAPLRLRRARFEAPPAPEAFRGVTPEGREAWFRFNRESESYEMLVEDGPSLVTLGMGRD